MTSNVGSDRIQESSRRGEDDERLKDKLMDVLRHTLRPEFLNRVDETVKPRPPSPPDGTSLQESVAGAPRSCSGCRGGPGKPPPATTLTR